MRGSGRLGPLVLTAVAFAVVLLGNGCDAGNDEPITSSPSVVATASPAIDGTPVVEEPKYGGILVLANRSDPPAAFDTMRTSSIALHHVAGSLFGPGNLVKRCRENMYIVCRDLARSWVTNGDFTEWIFTIRDDALWHDGTPFTAEDAMFWFKMASLGIESGDRVRAPAYFRGDLGEIVKLEVLDGNRLRVVLKEPAPHYIEVLSNPRLKIAHPSHLMQPRIDQGGISVSPLDVGLVGMGPFQFLDYDKGKLVQVRRFEEYWERDAMARRLPYLDGIDFVVIPDPAAMDAAFRSGRLAGGARGEGHYLSVERKRGYDRDLGDGVFYAEMQGGLFRLAFNVLNDGPWQDVGVRKAISLWIDKQAAVPSVLGGFGYVSPILGPDNPFTSGDYKTWPRFNPDRLERDRVEAMALMEEAGYDDGFSMGYLCRAMLVIRCEFLQAELAGLNINLELRVVDEGEWNRGRVSLDYDSQPGAHFTAPIPEGTESVFGRYSENSDAYAKHEDEKIDRLYDTLRKARTHAQRVRAWREIERYVILEQVYVIPIAGTLQVVPYRSYVKGVIIPPEDGHTHTDFATVWLDR